MGVGVSGPARPGGLCRLCRIFLAWFSGWLLVTGPLAGGREVSLSWGPSRDSSVTKYRLHYGLTPDFLTGSIDLGSGTNATVSLPVGGFTYHLAIGAVNSDGMESKLVPLAGTVSVPPDGTPVELFTAELELDEDTSLVLFEGLIPGASAALLVPGRPSHGKLIGPLETLEYVPEPGFFGTDSFRLLLALEGQSLRQFTFLVNVLSVEDSPEAQDLHLITSGGEPLEILLAGSDEEGAPLSFHVTVPPQFGTLSGEPPSLTYVAEPGFVGEDTIEYISNDGELDSLPATIHLYVEPQDVVPVVLETELIIQEETPTAIEIWQPPLESEQAIVTVERLPSHGVLTGSSSNLVYSPYFDYFGPDLLSYTVLTPHGVPTEVVVNITVEPVNDSPYGIPATVFVERNSTGIVRLLGTDPDGDLLGFRLLSAPAHGTLQGTPPVLEYLPDEGYVGLDSFTFAVHDAYLESSGQTVTIEVIVPDSPLPRLETEVGTNGRLQLAWQAVRGRTYRILYKPDLKDDWMIAGTAMLEVGERVTWPINTTQGAGFFAIELVPFSGKETMNFSHPAARFLPVRPNVDWTREDAALTSL